MKACKHANLRGDLYQYSATIYHQYLAGGKLLFHEVNKAEGNIFWLSYPFYRQAVSDGSVELLTVCRRHAVPEVCSHYTGSYKVHAY